MEAYLDFLAVVVMTACAVLLVGGVITMGVLVYKIIKDEY